MAQELHIVGMALILARRRFKMYTYIATKKVGTKRIGIAGISFTNPNSCIRTGEKAFEKLGISGAWVTWGDVSRQKNYIQAADFIDVPKTQADELHAILDKEVRDFLANNLG
jgi:hypothetical protein